MTEAAYIALLRQLIAFPTVSRDSNLALIEFVRGYLAEHGVQSDLIYDEDGRKANLWATIGPDDRPGLCLSGHTDVVPTEGQAWTGDPFILREVDDRLIGRGACDMKGFLALVLALVPEFTQRDLKVPVHLAFSYDEEVGCLGVCSLLDWIERRSVKPLACLVGEPTEMQPITGHKGKLSLRAEALGREGHSSLPGSGVNAVAYAAELIVFLNSLARRKATEGPFDPAFTPPYTTIHTGVVAGGTALNIVPNHCVVEFECRNLPADDPEAIFAEIQDFVASELEPAMQAVDPRSGFSFTEMAAFPGLDLPESHPLAQLVFAVTGANAAGKVSFGTEAGRFQDRGIPALVIGPGSIEQAHKPDEFITRDQMRKGEAFLRKVVDQAQSGFLASAGMSTW